MTTNTYRSSACPSARRFANSCLLLTLCLTPCLTRVAVPADEIPARPDEIEFEPLRFEPPRASDYRRVLSSGVPVYVAPSQEFPLVTVRFDFRGGSYLEKKPGVASMTGAMIRRGGSSTMTAEELDEEFDFLAADCSTSSSGARLNCLVSSFDRAFGLFVDMLREPRLQADKVKVYREQVLESMKQRNDDAGDILGREWDFLFYGQDHFLGRVSTAAEIRSITEEDMREYHEKVFQPGNLIIAVSGDFEIEKMLETLESALEGWRKGERMPTPPPPTRTFEPAIYHVEKEIPQGKVFIGTRSVTRDHPDYFPLLIMNDILGGGGFTSRIMSRVRSDEGLAYSAGSSLTTPVYYPGEFRAFFQSKNRTVALAIKVIYEEIASIRSEKVSEKELETSRSTFIETFPRTFESRDLMLSVFVDDEWTERPSDYWQTYRDRVRAVTADDVLRVAKEHLEPGSMAIFVVGKWDEIAPGDLGGRASMAEFFEGRRVKVPLRDPLTLAPIDG